MNSLTQGLLSVIDEQLAVKRQANPRLSYGGAWKTLASERPDLFRAYNKAAAGDPKADCRDEWRLLASERSSPGGQQGDSAARVARLARALAPIEEQIHLKQLANAMSWGDAWQQVERERPDLIETYNAAAGYPPGLGAQEILARSLALIDEAIRNERQKNQALSYGMAWQKVQGERPDLFQTYNEAARRIDNKHSDPASRTAPVKMTDDAGTGVVLFHDVLLGRGRER